MNIKKNIRIYRNWLMKGHGMKIWQKFHLDSWFGELCWDNGRGRKYGRKSKRGNKGWQDSLRESSRFKHRTFTISRSIRYLSRYPPPFSGDYCHFLVSSVPMFPFSWFSRLGNTLDNTPDRRRVLLVNTKQSGKRTPPTRHVSF